MPACLTHSQFAAGVLKRIPGGDDMDLGAYAWGAQGPDFLFAHRYLPWMGKENLRAYGNRLHENDPVKTLGALRDFLKSHREPGFLSYARGFLCHYALDSTAHPYINGKAAQLLEERPEETMTTLHGEIEAALDAIILRRETGKLPSEVSTGACFPKNEAVQRRIAMLYRDLIFAALGEDVPEAGLYQATRDAHFVFGLLTDRSGLKYSFFDRLERGRAHVITSHIVPITERDDVDYANIQRQPWSWKGICGDEDFFTLYDRAGELALKLISRLQAADDAELAQLTQGRPFG